MIPYNRNQYAMAMIPIAAISIAITVALAVSAHAAPIKTPSSLTWENIEAVEQYLKLKPADENYQKVIWHSTVIEGQRKAQSEDKPLILWLYFGDPRGNC